MKYIDYKQLNPFQRFAYNSKEFFKGLPGKISGFFKSLVKTIVNFFVGIGKGVSGFFTTFVKGDWATKLSYFIFGIGDLHKGKYYKGILFFLAEVFYIVYMVSFGWTYISEFTTLGDTETQTIMVDGFPTSVQGDNSMLILLFSVLTIAITLVILAIYVANIKDAYKHQLMREAGKKPTSLKKDFNEFLDGKYQITLLSFPVLMISIFQILPLIFMILIAFTNYDSVHPQPGTLLSWVGFDTFGSVFDLAGTAIKAHTFVGLAQWTVVWAIAATFSNYIIGMIIALMINKKGIKLKSLWRTLFVIAIAVPQFVSLLLMNQMLQTDGAFNILLSNITGQNFEIQWLNSTPLMARTIVIIVNLWVGVPYTILSMSGILMNIPEDLYESARIDGAGPVRTFTSITLPYMLFVTTPQLITQFVGNINNFNVIFLLTSGGPNAQEYYQAGYTDILVTWLYKLTTTVNDYNLASVIGILVFIVCSTLTLIVYNSSKSAKDEEAFS